jgi:hypothetical protein
MPILLMALLALLVFGLIGIVLTVAMVSEHSRLRLSATRKSACSRPYPAASFHSKP